METQYLKDYSPALGRDMEIQFYGNAGQPVRQIPFFINTLLYDV